jgi:hypothetical protein
MKLLTESAFNLPPLPPPDVLNSLASTRWSHWGMREPARLDYALHDTITLMQGRILAQLLTTSTLSRLHDMELKQAADVDTYTLAEHVRTLVDGIYSEIRNPARPGEYNNRQPYINSLRRELQRMALREFVGILNASPPRVQIRAAFNLTRGVPEDARTLVRMHLIDLDKQIAALLGTAEVKLDDYTKAHLLDTQERIRKALQAQMIVDTID